MVELDESAWSPEAKQLTLQYTDLRMMPPSSPAGPRPGPAASVLRFARERRGSENRLCHASLGVSYAAIAMSSPDVLRLWADPCVVMRHGGYGLVQDGAGRWRSDELEAPVERRDRPQQRQARRRGESRPRGLRGVSAFSTVCACSSCPRTPILSQFAFVLPPSQLCTPLPSPIRRSCLCTLPIPFIIFELPLITFTFI